MCQIKAINNEFAKVMGMLEAASRGKNIHDNFIDAMRNMNKRITDIEQSEDIDQYKVAEEQAHRIIGAVKLGISAIYFNDNSDYQGALWDIVRLLDPQAASLLEVNPAEANKRFGGGE